MNRKEAQMLVEDELNNSNSEADSVECVVLGDETIEKEWGWVFFYQSKAFVESGDFRDMLGGNAPIIVDRNTGSLIYTGTSYDIEHYIKEYES